MFSIPALLFFCLSLFVFPYIIVCWYAARVKYRTEKKIKHFLERKGIPHYIPFQEDKPVIPCVVFIRTDYRQAIALPVESSYIYDTDTKKFQVIPDKQMQDFMFLQDFADKTFVLPDPENLKGGERVRVIAGEFAGIEGNCIGYGGTSGWW